MHQAEAAKDTAGSPHRAPPLTNGRRPETTATRPRQPAPIKGQKVKHRQELPLIILGVILLIIGFIAKIAIIWTIGIIAVVIGAILALLGLLGHAVGGHRHYF